MEQRNLTCIGCPMGCQIQVEMQDGEILSVQGNTCPRGEAYARKEVTHPTRIVTSTVRVSGSRSGAVTVSCKTANDVPKDKIFHVMRGLTGLSVVAPVHIGDVIASDIGGTGVDVIATKEVR